MNLTFASVLSFIAPWKFSPAVVLMCGGALFFYIRGLLVRSVARESPGILRNTAFFTGVVSIYFLMQSRLDYWSLHSFWMHRAQHAVLHHAAPFLIALSAPAATLVRGTPENLRQKVFVPLWKVAAVRKIYAFVQQPVIATALFIGLMGYWLMPSHQFEAMLSDVNYGLMNWSVLIEGLLFWWMMLEPSHAEMAGNPGFGKRILLQWIVIMALIGMGFTIVYSESTLYPVYAICGRLWPISPMTDQEYGGMITWMPTSIISILAGVILLSRWMRDSEKRENPDRFSQLI
ncbi:MAG: cytochrome c oxidase assembly protein [Acidiferrobacterales bacterium]